MIYREEIDTLLSEIHALRIAVERIALLAQEMGLESVRRLEARDQWPEESTFKPQVSLRQGSRAQQSEPSLKSQV